MFRVIDDRPGQAAANDKGEVDYAQDFFQRPAYLTVSGQLEGEIYATALGKIYTFGPTFRAENSNTTRHLAEFWMVEPEAAFFELDDNMALAERFLKRICRDVLADCQEDMQFFAEHVDKAVHRPARKRRRTRFPPAQLHRGGRDPESVRQDVRVSRSSGATTCRPSTSAISPKKNSASRVILYDYPAAIKPFYMRVNDDGKTVRAMDVLVPGVGEIIGGSQREERLDVLEARMERAGPQHGRLLVVSRPAPLRHRAPLRLRPGPGADGPIRHRHGQHPRRDPLPAHAGQRGVLKQFDK